MFVDVEGIPEGTALELPSGPFEGAKVIKVVDKVIPHDKEPVTLRVEEDRVLLLVTTLV